MNDSKDCVSVYNMNEHSFDAKNKGVNLNVPARAATGRLDSGRLVIVCVEKVSSDDGLTDVVFPETLWHLREVSGSDRLSASVVFFCFLSANPLR